MKNAKKCVGVFKVIIVIYFTAFMLRHSNFICFGDNAGTINIENNGSNVLVTDAFDGSFSYALGGNANSVYNFQCKIPQVNLEGAEIENFNKSLYDSLHFAFEQASVSDPPSCGNVWYEWAVKDDVLSIVIRSEIPFTEGIFYNAYNIGISEARQLTKEEVAQAAGLTAEQYEQQLAETMKNYWNKMIERDAAYYGDNNYEELLYKTISSENTQTAQPFFNQESELCAVCRLYIPAGGGEGYYLLNFTTAEVCSLFEKNMEQPDTGENSESPQQFDDEGNIFEQLPEIFGFSSGAGGWGTEFVLQTDGSFNGDFHDSDMGDIGEEYPNGTVHICRFGGKFTTPVHVGEYIYSMKLEYLEMEQSQGQEYYENGQRYICEQPYGLENAEELLIYLPGCPLSDVAEGFLSWSFINREARQTIPSGYFGIYNVNDEHGFVGLREDSIWGKTYTYSYGENEATVSPSYYAKSHLTFWSGQDGAVMNLAFDWPDDGQQEVGAVDTNGNGEYRVRIQSNEENASLTITVNSIWECDFSLWGGGADGTITAEYILEG